MTDPQNPDDGTRQPRPDRGMPTAGRKPDARTEAASADLTAEAATADPSTEAATADLSTEAATADPSTEAATADLSTQAATGGAEAATADPPGEAATADLRSAGPDREVGDGSTVPVRPPAPPAGGHGAAAAEEADDDVTAGLVAADDEPTVEHAPPAGSAAAWPPVPSGPAPVRVGDGPSDAPEGRGDPEVGPGELDTVRLTPPAVVPGRADQPATRDRTGSTDATRRPGNAGAAGGRAAGAGDESGGGGGAAEAGGGEVAGPSGISSDVVNSGEVAGADAGVDVAPVPEDGVDLDPPEGRRPVSRRLSSAGALIWVLLALFGFTLVVQLRSNSADEGLATARQEDLVRILSDLEARDQRLQAEINTLEQSQRQLSSGVQGRQAALAEADRRADELGLLAGTKPGRGPGLLVVIDPKGQVKASAILNAVQELRGAGGEVMQIEGTVGGAVRIVASSYFVDADGGGIVVDGSQLSGPYKLSVIGVPQTMQTALQIPGGVVASVNSAGGSVTMEARSEVQVTAVRKAASLQYARPVS